MRGLLDAPVATEWDERAARLLARPEGFLRVLGGPGTGKTTLLRHIAAARIRATDSEAVLLLTASRRAANEARAAITGLVANSGEGVRTVREPAVRTVHSYAFAVLRRQAAMREFPPPRLLSGPEQDTVVRELLAGDVESGARYWPGRLRPALPLPGFANELRDLLLRAAERGLGPEDLIKLGKRHHRDEWVAAGTFGRQYEQVTLLHGAVGADSPQATAPALDAAELVAAALLAFDTDHELLVAERARVRHLLVDDAQHLDPLSYELITKLGSRGEFLLAGDPDQAVSSFRGADPRLLADADPDGDRTLRLAVDHRMAPEIAAAAARLAARLPGAYPHRGAARPATRTSGAVAVRVLASAAAEAAWITDELRRAHLIDGVPWSQMAVLLRASRSLPVLRRALRSAGVPLVVPAGALPLGRQPAVRPLLSLLRVAEEPDALDGELAAELLTSPLGGSDPMALRRLRRGLRRLEAAAGGERGSSELLVEVLRGEDPLRGLSDVAAAPARRVAALLGTAREALGAGGGIEQALWQVWRASGLERRWSDGSARGGAAGLHADRDLDAVVALFEAAARYTDRLPGASVGGFADYLAAQQIAGDSLAPVAPEGESVAVLTAHAAVGRQWTVVAVPGVQEGSWPDLRQRGSLLGAQRLVDTLAGLDERAPLSATAPLLAEERRLLLVAVSRASRTLLVSAVRGEDEQPSRFLDELVPAPQQGPEPPPVFTPRRGLVLGELVGELRRVVCDGEQERARRDRAARQLARLAAAGVTGAHPDHWYGLPEPSADTPLWSELDVVPVTPSTVDTLVRCPLRWAVERHGGADPSELPQIAGILVHTLAQAVASGADAAEVDAELERAWAGVDAGAPWFSRREQARLRAMLEAFRVWLAGTRRELTQVDLERALEVDVPGGRPMRVRGRVDRLEIDAEGRPVVVDLKTAKNAITGEDAGEHPQLALYQLASVLGAFLSEVERPDPGGARLLYVGKTDRRTGRATERAQPPLDAAQVQRWLEIVRKAGAAAAGPRYTATENPDCPRCPVRVSCPLQDAGRQVCQ